MLYWYCNFSMKVYFSLFVSVTSLNLNAFTRYYFQDFTSALQRTIISYLNAFIRYDFQDFIYAWNKLSYLLGSFQICGAACLRTVHPNFHFCSTKGGMLPGL